MVIQYLGESGTKQLINSINQKLDKKKLYPLKLKDYNELVLKNLIEDDVFYFIVDFDDEIFDKISELYDIVENLKSEIEDAKSFKNSFPIDNRTYGIINQQPKNLSEVFPDELGIPTDNNNQDTNES